jgi:acetyl-CoA acyltransferase
MRETVIVSAVRTPVGKAKKGSLAHVHPVDLGAIALTECLHRTPGLSPNEIDDVIVGCAIPEAEQGMDIARLIAARAGLPVSVPGVTVNRFCSSGLQSIADATARIMCGYADVIVAGGVESMSQVPMTGNKLGINPYLVQHFPQIYMSMGHTAEQVAKRFAISRQEQDAFAARSHQRAYRAITGGVFAEETVAVKVEEKTLVDGRKPEIKVKWFTQDEGVRPETTPETLAALKPVFHVNGTVTAGNSSQMSDGAAFVVVMAKEKADELGLVPLGALRSFAVCGVDPDIMWIGPAVAIPKAVEKAGLAIDQIDLFEINEAFAAQVVYVLKALELDERRVNVNGGAIALGHPLGCTGTKLTVSLLHELKRRNGRYGVVSMCIGGGMGAAAVFEIIH